MQRDRDRCRDKGQTDAAAREKAEEACAAAKKELIDLKRELRDVSKKAQTGQRAASSESVRLQRALEDVDKLKATITKLKTELRDGENYEQFKKDVADANIFIGSLIFIEELADKVIDAVQPQRERLDACLVFPSMPAVVPSPSTITPPRRLPCTLLDFRTAIVPLETLLSLIHISEPTRPERI